MNHLESIDLGLESTTPYNEIVRKVYLAYPTKVFEGKEEQQYQILNEISCFFDIPIMSVQVAGSAKTGHSFHKKREFIEGKSDLDVAIIDANLYRIYMEKVFKITKGYSIISGFPLNKDGISVFEEYKSYLNRGIFRADLMPSSEFRKAWNKFFGKLSSKHGDTFRKIDAGIYMSQCFFESKQRSAIKLYADRRAV